jgi:hypothetical protein
VYAIVLVAILSHYVSLAEAECQHPKPKVMFDFKTRYYCKSKRAFDIERVFDVKTSSFDLPATLTAATRRG